MMQFFDEKANIALLFSSYPILVGLIMSICNTLLLLSVSYKFLQIMQQSGYERSGYFKWLRRRDNIYLRRLATVSMLSVLAFLLFNITFAFSEGEWSIYCGFIFYAIFIISYRQSEEKRIQKVPLNYTARMRRLIAVYIAVLFIACMLLVIASNLIAFALRFNQLFVRIRYVTICIMPVCVPFLVIAAYYITKPFENKRQKKYIAKCTQTLCAHPTLKRIGITGSYGKTSVKEILKTILEEKYKVLATPSSYNTPMGICKTVKKLQPDTQIFIAEMGARHMGDISYLASIVKPDYAIINGIVGQHLETFGSLAAIRQTKYELVESMSDGVVAYTVDNENTSSMFADCKIKSIPAGTQLNNSPAVYADDIKTTCNGSDFTLHLYDKCVRCHTSLLGKHNITNICLAAAIAYEIGLKPEEISGAISRLNPIKHRLECIKSKGGITIIDDSYNANADGISAAMQVLSCFSGRKIAVTPGLVELGREEDLENYRLGKKMAEVCNIAVLVGKSATYRIQDGLVDGGFNPENIIICKDLESAKKKLKKMLCEGDVVLFENDLPDKFA